jgi:hypothetical protein
MGNRITRDRPLTPDEKKRNAEIRQQIAGELPEIKLRAKAIKPRILLRHVLHTLKQERERIGLSLEDLSKKSGIDCQSLARSENDLDPEVSMNFLLRYAAAIGKTLTVQVEDCATNSGP